MPTIRELVEEAEENYGTGRHGNSGPLFKRAGLQALAHGATPDALYLLYRALLDYETIDQPISQLQLLDVVLTEIAKIIRGAASQLLQESEDVNDDEIIKILKIQVNAMEILKDEEEKEVVLQSLQQEFVNLYSKTQQSGYLEEALELQYSDQLVITYLTAVLSDAEHTLVSGSFDVELVAVARIFQAFQYLPSEYHRDVRDDQSESKPAAIVEIIAKLQEFLDELITSSLQDDQEQLIRIMQRYQVDYLQFLLDD